MNKLTPSQMKTYVSGLAPSEIISFEELSDPMANHQQAKSRIRQQMTALIDRASSQKENLILVRGK